VGESEAVEKRYPLHMDWDHVKQQIAGLSDELVNIRHDLHRHPELGFEEHRTQGVVRAWLERHGYAPREMAGTGLVADLRPGSSGPTIALRADMDALPMQESTELPYCSIHDGRAHKCGHDGHTTILMGTAAILARMADSIDGNVRLIFQPAEEGVRGGGATVMVSEGVLDGVDEVYGLHTWPVWPMGELRIVGGPIMAQVNAFEKILVTGKGGHGGMPEKCRDPIVAAAHLVSSLQTVVSRGLGAAGGAVVSICAFNAGTTDNVIPDSAHLLGTVRTFDGETRRLVTERIKDGVEGTTVAFGVGIDLEFEDGFPVLVNDSGCVEVVSRVARDMTAVTSVSAADLPMAGGEDFAYFAAARPSAFFFLGAGRDGEDTPGCHHPDFDFDDELTGVGVELFLRIVADRLPG